MHGDYLTMKKQINEIFFFIEKKFSNYSKQSLSITVGFGSLVKGTILV